MRSLTLCCDLVAFYPKLKLFNSGGQDPLSCSDSTLTLYPLHWNDTFEVKCEGEESHGAQANKKPLQSNQQREPKHYLTSKLESEANSEPAQSSEPNGEEQQIHRDSKADHNNQDLQVLLEQLKTEGSLLDEEVQSLFLTESEPSVDSVKTHLDFGQSVEEECENHRLETERMKSTLRSRRSGSPTRANTNNRSPTRQTPVKGGTYDSELMRVLRERDELQNMLERYERHLSEVQANIRVLTADRDKTRMQYQQAQDEIANLRRMVMKPKTSRGPRNSVTAQSILKRLETERDEAVTDLHRMSTERDSLRERLQISQETAISERAHLEQSVEDLQNAVLTLEQERGEQKSRQAQMKEAMMGLEEEVHTLGRKLTASEDELGRLKNECTMLRLSNTHAESALSETQRRLTSRIVELQNTLEKNKELDERNDVLQKEISGLKEEMRALQVTVTELDQHKYSLQEQLERKNDLLGSANKKLDDKDNTIHSLQLRIEDLETTVEASKEIGVNRERDLDVLRRKLLGIEDELASVLKVKDAMQRENTQLRDELDRTRVDNQSLKHKLEGEAQEVEDLQRKVENYVADISRVEDLLSSKERECRELQECRRRVSAQSDSWEDQARQAESNVTDLQLKLRTSDSEKRRLKDRVGSLESSLQEALSAERSCSTDLTQLREELRRAQDEHSNAQHDLEKTRELCVKLDTSKEVVQQELEACRSELELLKKQLVNERASARSLEAMLTSTREKELRRHLSSQERLSEIQLLRDKLTMADSKASSHSREIAQLRTRSAQIEADLEATRRQLSTERFERERASQELRRLGLSSSLRSPILSSTMCSTSPSRRSLSPRRPWSPEHSLHTSTDHREECDV